MPLTVVIPLTPPSDLFPNAARRLDYHRRHALEKDLREASFVAALAAAQQIRDINGGIIFLGPVTVDVVVHWEKGRRRPDCSALALAVKAMEDGLTDAGIWRDDSQVVRSCYSQWKASPTGGHTSFTIRPAEED